MAVAEALAESQVCDLALLSAEHHIFGGYETSCRRGLISIMELLFLARFRMQALRMCLQESATPAQVLGGHLPPAYPARAICPASIFSQAWQGF